jgi:chemotaxis protein histidine kinase CheA
MTEILSPIGFWSYARQDDEERLSALRSILQRQLQQKYGREPIKIFQDVAAIPPGADWNMKISEALHSSTFLIPIITPNFLESEWCNQEFFLFLEREQAIANEFPELAQAKRIFPIFYIDITDVDAFRDDLLPELRKRQWTNFRDLIYKSDTHEDVRLRLDQIAESIVKVLRLDQRAARERRNVAAQEQAAQAAAAQQAALAQKAAAEQKAKEDAALRSQQEEAARIAREAQQAQQAREAEAQAQLRAQQQAEQQARDAEAQARRLAEQQQREQAARIAREAQLAQEAEAQRQRAAQFAAQQAASGFGTRPVPTPTPFWRTPAAIIAAAAVSLCLIIVVVVALSSSSSPRPQPQPVPGPIASTSPLDTAKAAQASGDYSTAADLFNKACADGSGTAEACVDLGTLYSTGQGVTADTTMAGKLFQQGCSAGDQDGCAKLKVLQTALAALNGQGDNNAAARARREAAARRALEQ